MKPPDKPSADMTAAELEALIAARLPTLPRGFKDAAPDEPATRLRMLRSRKAAKCDRRYLT
jgi:hypothetical protein